jgi:HPt (histidine-containing phosphotransfer) domain-containing protein
LQAGFDSILTKPIILDEFYSTIDVFLKSNEKINTYTDKSLLDSHSSVNLQANNDSFQSLVNQFLQSLKVELIDIKQLIKEQNWTRCQKQMHNIKGRGGSFGFPEITEQASGLEVLLKNNEFEKFSNDFISFSDHCEQIILKSTA